MRLAQLWIYKNTKIRKYEKTKIRKYENTKIRKYKNKSTKILKKKRKKKMADNPAVLSGYSYCEVSLYNCMYVSLPISGI